MLFYELRFFETLYSLPKLLKSKCMLESFWINGRQTNKKMSRVAIFDDSPNECELRSTKRILTNLNLLV